MKNRVVGLAAGLLLAAATSGAQSRIGREVAIERHLQDGEEFQLSVRNLIEYGRKVFTACWTSQEGGGRPLTKGTGAPLSDPDDPLLFPRNFNRISAPDANSCSGCHNLPFGIPGGGGDIVANVFVLGQRFDFAMFDQPNQPSPATKSASDERGRRATLPAIANSRATIGMFGSGYIEMLARQITADLQAIRDRTPPGGASALVSKGISFGTLRRTAEGMWDTSRVEGIPAPSLVSAGSAHPPSLIIRPFHQAGNVISLREFSNNAFNHHHGMQSEERFGRGEDPDGDGFVNELTVADLTAVTIYQATMAVPGRAIPNDPEIEEAVLMGEERFKAIGCARCHIPALPLDRRGWIFSEPNPYNPAGNLRPGDAPVLKIDLTSEELPPPRLKPENDLVLVPAYTDLKLHDITSGPDDPNAEALDMNQPPGSPAFFAGNRKFLTKKLWGAANEPPFFHHGKFTTMREAVLAHTGEALASRRAFDALPTYERDCIIEFLKTLQVLPPGAKFLVVDEKGKKKEWPPKMQAGVPPSGMEAGGKTR